MIEKAQKIAVVIPARYRSRRFPGKALALLEGHPLIEHVWRRACRANGVSGVLVATDDERIRKVVEAFGGKVVMTSPDCRTGTDRVAEVARTIDAEIVVNVQGDEPCLEPRAIEDVCRPFREDSTLGMATLMCPLGEGDDPADRNIVKVVTDQKGYALYFSRAPIPFSAQNGTRPFRHVGVYAFRREFLLRFAQLPQTPLELAESLEQLRALEHGFPIRVIRTEYFECGVDTPEQLESLRRRFERGTQP